MSRTEENKTFIMQCPHHWPGKKVVAAGKRNKLHFSTTFVYAVRGANGITKLGPRKNSQKAFVLSKPATMDDADVVAAAKEAGLTITENYVRYVRSSPRLMVNGAAAPATVASTVEEEFNALVIRISTERAMELLRKFPRVWLP